MRMGRWAATFGLAAVLAMPILPSVAQESEGGEQNAWVKICNTDPAANKELCLITQELRTNSGQFLASAAIREFTGEARKSMLLSVPVGMVIRPGVQLQIDGGEPEKAEYQICFPNACYAERAIDQAFIERLKAGGKLRLVAYNQQGKQVRFDLTLIGFTSAYEGDGIDPDALQQKQATLQRELEQRAQEARDRLVAEQRRAVDEATEAPPQ
ncbi:invasion associated locus B family protein [Acuticoccus sp.]|uniref:invasion associated locus B family protein n=1 Tax=Acuticoccus sp. TaxID=1904378 RepID=UPI003B517A30